MTQITKTRAYFLHNGLYVWTEDEIPPEFYSAKYNLLLRKV